MIYGSAVWVAILAWAILGPPIRRGASHSSNTPLRVSLPDDSILEASGQSPAGVKAQEVGEFRLSWIAGLIAALPAAIMLEGLIGALAVAIGAALAHAVARKLTNSFDYVGHGIEIIVAEREGRVGYRTAEIRRMIDWDPARKGMTAEQVDAKLRRWHWLARLTLKILL